MLRPHDVESMRRSLAIGGQLTPGDAHLLVNGCAQLLAERDRIERILLQLGPAGARTIDVVDDLRQAMRGAPPFGAGAGSDDDHSLRRSSWPSVWPLCVRLAS